jgi:hypothetical protein
MSRCSACLIEKSLRRAVGRAKPPAHYFDVAQVLRGVPAVRLSAGNGASFSAFRQRTRVRLLPALRFGSRGPSSSVAARDRVQPGEIHFHA